MIVRFEMNFLCLRGEEVIVNIKVTIVGDRGMRVYLCSIF